MGEQDQQRVLIIGAGAMGIITGYHLSLTGANITFLVRPHRVEVLKNPQLLYSYDDIQLKEYKGYQYITDPSEIASTAYDFIVITLDASALRNEVGQQLARTIGDAVRQKPTKVILGSIFVNLLPWFLETSGLRADQVTYGCLGTLIYSTKAVDLPLHATTDLELIVKADFAYTDALGHGFIVDDNSVGVANAFMDLYNTSGASRCVLMPAVQLALFANPLFAVFAGSKLLGWPNIRDIDPQGEVWKLTTAAVKEIQGLSIHGEDGQQAANATSEVALKELFAGLEKQSLPLDFQGFNRYHHGGKVNQQDRQILDACVSYGEAEGKQMAALKELVQRVRDYQDPDAAT